MNTVIRKPHFSRADRVVFLVGLVCGAGLAAFMLLG